MDVDISGPARSFKPRMMRTSWVTSRCELCGAVRDPSKDERLYFHVRSFTPYNYVARVKQVRNRQSGRREDLQLTRLPQLPCADDTGLLEYDTETQLDPVWRGLPLELAVMIVNYTVASAFKAMEWRRCLVLACTCTAVLKYNAKIFGIQELPFIHWHGFPQRPGYYYNRPHERLVYTVMVLNSFWDDCINYTLQRVVFGTAVPSFKYRSNDYRWVVPHSHLFYNVNVFNTSGPTPLEYDLVRNGERAGDIVAVQTCEGDQQSVQPSEDTHGFFTVHSVLKHIILIHHPVSDDFDLVVEDGRQVFNFYKDMARLWKWIFPDLVILFRNDPPSEEKAFMIL